MSGAQTLRALVNERLAAAAEDIFVLIERTMAEYEEELCRSKQENQRKQQLLDKVLKVQLVRANVQIPSESPDPEMKQEITQTPRTKEEPEEQSVKQEEEHLPVSVPESSPVCVKTEESSLLQQRQTEHREEAQGEDISSDSDTDNDDDWEQFSRSAAKSTGLFPKYKSAPQSGVHGGDASGAEGKYWCPFCIGKSFTRKDSLRLHMRTHTGEKPYSCSICHKTFTENSNLNMHMRTHTGEKPYSCTVCEKTFTQKGHLDSHLKTHTGEKPYSCSICKMTTAEKSNLNKHMRLHTGEKSCHSCSVCHKTFSQKASLLRHELTHTGEKPFSCSVCNNTFTLKSNLKKHMRLHTR